MNAIIFNDYINKRVTIVDCVNNYNEAVSRAESLALNYVYEKQGIGYGYKFYCKSKSGKWGNTPYGYFCCKGQNKSKYVIYNKTMDYGIIYNANVILKICSFEVGFINRDLYCRQPLCRRQIPDLEIIAEEIDDKLDMFEPIHLELLEAIKSLEKKDSADDQIIADNV